MTTPGTDAVGPGGAPVPAGPGAAPRAGCGARVDGSRPCDDLFLTLLAQRQWADATIAARGGVLPTSAP